jgi:hypothetical protein
VTTRVSARKGFLPPSPRGARRPSRPARVVLAAALGLALLAPAIAGARTIEAVGAVGVKENDRRDPKDRAVQAALREAVWRVAEELMVDAVLIEDPDRSRDDPEEPDLAGILGSDMVDYTARFKILEDRGLGPALFVEEPGISTEYVVVAEVDVEVDRVRERLTEAGLLEPESFTPQAGTVQLEVEGLSVYPALRDLETLLVERLGARSAVPVRLERGRAVLSVGTSLAGPDLVSRLEASAPGNLSIVPLSASGGQARIAVRWAPAVDAAPAGGALPSVESGVPRWARP